MRKINYDEFIEAKKNRYFKVPALLGRKRLVKSKPRDKDERNSLMRFNYQKYQQRLKSGELVELSPRKYLIKL